MDSELNDSSLRKKTDSDSIVRGILSNSIKYNNEKQSGLKISLLFVFIIFAFFFFKGDSSSTLTRLLNRNDTPRIPTPQPQFQLKVIK
jgi:hypothetical protein